MTNRFPDQNASLQESEQDEDEDEDLPALPEPDPDRTFTGGTRCSFEKPRASGAAYQYSGRIIEGLNQDNIDLAQTIGDAPIPKRALNDNYWRDHPKAYEFKTMLRTIVYQRLRGIQSDAQLERFLDNHPRIALDLGFGTETEQPASLRDFTAPATPHQTTITRTANERFCDAAEMFIDETVREVREYAQEHDHVPALAELWSEDPTVDLSDDPDEEAEEEIDPQSLTKAQIRRLTNEMMRHVAPNLDFQRGKTRRLRKNLFLEVIGHCCLTNSSVYGGGDTYDIYAKPTEEELPHGKTFFDHMKSLSLDEMLEMFDAAIDSMVGAAQDIGHYDRPVDLAIDVTTVGFTGLGKRVSFESISDPEADGLSKREAEETRVAIEKWDLEPVVGETAAKIRQAAFDDPEKQAAAERVKGCVEWVQGTKHNDEEIEYGFQFAACAIAEPTMPMIVGVDPISGRTGEEMADHVSGLVERAQKIVTVDTVYADKAYFSAEVVNQFHHGHGFRTSDRLDVEYVIPIPARQRERRQLLEERWKDLDHAYADGRNDVTVMREYPFGGGANGQNAFTTAVAVPRKDVDEVEDKVEDRVMFATNRQGATPAELHRTMNRYSDRWIIENGFRDVKKFLAKTQSREAEPRLFYFLLGTLLFNCWRLTDSVAKQRLGVHNTEEPIIKFEVFTAAVINSLRPID